MNLIAKELVMVAKELLAKIPKQKWMSLMEEEVAKVIPDVAAIRSHDYWDTATYLYNQGNTPQEAAQEMVILIQKHKVSSEMRLAWGDRMNFPRTFYLPKNAPNLKQLDVGKDVGVEVWSYEDAGGRLYGIAFGGKANKPLWHYRFRNQADLDKRIQDTIEGYRSHMEMKQKRQQERREYKHGLKVGDILVSSWGYDQTNTSWYQVVEIGAKTVKIREIASQSAGEDHVLPAPNHFTGPVMTKIVRQGNIVSIASYASAYPWDGKPKYETPFGMGH